MKKSLAQWFKSSYIYFIEILLILLWALWVGKEYLNFDTNMWPYGREYAFGIRTHFIWENFKECGTCIFWNGSTMGGSPAFAELQGGVLNPIVIMTTLLAGVVNGSKLILLFSLFLAGFAQWWLAKSLKVGRLARLWSAGMAVVGGHLAGRMELGLVGMVFSTAFCSLAIASSIDLALTGRRLSAIILGIILAMAITSGQIYMQVGFLIGIVPALLIIIFSQHKLRLQPVWKEFLLAGILAVLLAGVFIVPHFTFFTQYR